MLAELGIRARGFVVAALLALASTGGRIAFAQDHPAAPDAIPLTVPAGVPLHVVLEKPVLIKQVDVLVEAHVVDPVFVFDQLASPSGSQVLGRVTKVESASRKQRGLAIANCNFSPLRKAQVDFDTLVLSDGTRLALHSAVTQGAPKMVRLVAGEEDKWLSNFTWRGTMQKLSCRAILRSSALAGVSLWVPGAASSAHEKRREPVRKLNVVGVGGHFDDPQTCAGGTLTLYAEQGHNVVALSLTGGPPPAPDANPEDRSVKNRLNAMSMAKILKIRLDCLNYDGSDSGQFSPVVYRSGSEINGQRYKELALPAI